MKVRGELVFDDGKALQNIKANVKLIVNSSEHQHEMIIRRRELDPSLLWLLELAGSPT